MEEPGRLQSMGSHRVGHNWSDLAAAAAAAAENDSASNREMHYEVNSLSFQNLKTNAISQIAWKYILKLFLSPIIPQNKMCNKFQRKMKYKQY